MLPRCQACTPSILKYTYTDATIAGTGVQLPCSPALAFLYLCPPPPLATIHGSFASPGIQQCRKNGINASFIWIFPVGAPLASSSAWQLRIQELRTQLSERQGSSWVSGLLVGVRWRSSLLLCLTGTTLCLIYCQCIIANTTHKLHWHTRTHAYAHITFACFHALVRLCFGHKHRAQTSCATCIHAIYESG